MTAAVMNERSAAVVRWALLVATIALPPDPTIVGLVALVLVNLGQKPGWAGVPRAAMMGLAAVVGTVVVYAGG